MGIHIERDHGPSRLDEKLESLRDSDGNIWLHSREARDLLFPGLLAFYKRQMAQLSRSLEEIGSPGLPLNVEALAQIASLDGETRLVNLTSEKKEIARRRAQIREEKIARERAQLIQTRPEPPQAEF